MIRPTINIRPTPDEASALATNVLLRWLTADGVHNVMLAAGNTPLELYQRIGERAPSLHHLTVFALDEYIGVPMDEPRNCANLIRRTAIEPWGIDSDHYHTVASDEKLAEESVLAHERRIETMGGLDVIVLGLGQNGHLGFNEPGSTEDSGARVLDLDPISVEANRKWFDGDYAPRRGATVGMKTILNARRVVILAFGEHKRAAVQCMLAGPRTSDCPASLLQGHPCVEVILDCAAAGLEQPT